MPSRTLRSFLPSLLIVALGVVAYCQSFHVPLIFDDLPAIRENAHLRQLWPLRVPLTAPPESPLGARPVTSLSFAVNYALGGYNVTGYHVVNLGLHLLSALLLMGLLRRTFQTPALRDRVGGAGPTLAAIVAAVWVVHPLNSEAVVYTLQRTELLVSLFYLLTLRFAVRRFEGGRAWLWTPLTILACALGMGSKEIMVAAPLLVLVYDRTFFSEGSGEGAGPGNGAEWIATLRRRPGLYAGLAATWLLLVLLVLSEPRKDSAGFHHATGALDYLRTQAGSILHYLRLIAWPHPLSIIHPWPAVKSWGPALLPGSIVLALAAAAALAVARRWPAGVAGAAFFMILAPTSSIIPIVTEVAAERRMYLPSAAVLSIVIPSLYILARRFLQPTSDAATSAVIPAVSPEAAPNAAPVADSAPTGATASAASPPVWGRAVLIGLAAPLLVALTAGTLHRIHDFRTAVSIWENAVAQYPDSPDAINNLGVALGEADRNLDAIAAYERVLSIEPRYFMARINLGNCYYRLGRFAEAQPIYEKAVDLYSASAEAQFRLGQNLEALDRGPEAIKRYEDLLKLDPNHLAGRLNLGLLLQSQGRIAEALPHLEKAAKLDPKNSGTLANYAAALVDAGRSRDAEPVFNEALRLSPDHLGAHLGLGKALLDQNRLDEAERHLREAVAINDQLPAAHEYLGATLSREGRSVEAVTQFTRAMELKPNDPVARHNLATALAQIGRVQEAVDHFTQAAQLDPKNAARQVALAQALARLGRSADSLARLRKAVEIEPRSPDAHAALADALLEQSHTTEAIPHYREALKLHPRWAPAMTGLAWCLATRANCTHTEAQEAATLAQGAVDLTGGSQPRPLDALAAALAQAGQYDKAVAAGQRALERCVANGQHDLAQEIQGRLGLYLAKKPFVESHEATKPQ
ncbi:MAG: tetratricopeptide repeat protein [Planctomycetota bacterium]|nr:tetratricopeptide repeat protein [Planctomycetota bacterium]